MGKLPVIAPELADLPHVPIDSLEPFQGDLKELSKREYAKLKKSLLDNGIIVPFFVWKETGKILDGHQRERVFLNEGWLMDVPVIYISADSEQDAKQKLLVISSQYGRVTQEGWDEFTFDLDDEWIKQTVNFDALPLVFEDWDTGGDGGESQDAEPQISRADELQEIWQVKPGQLWRLPSRVEGQEHRIICGDCTDAAVVERLMGGEKADYMFTDPPYGVAYVGKTKDALTIENDNVSERELTEFVSRWFDVAETVTRDGAYWLATVPAGPLHSVFLLDWKRRGILRQIMCWVKDSMVLGHSEYHYRHEPILFGWRPGDRLKNSDRTKTTVWEFNRPKASIEHPTMKPTDMWEYGISQHSLVGDVGYEPFCGSGVSIIAAENLSRQCRAVEIHPPYVAVTLQRYLDAFGIEPELIG